MDINSNCNRDPSCPPITSDGQRVEPPVRPHRASSGAGSRIAVQWGLSTLKLDVASSTNKAQSLEVALYALDSASAVQMDVGDAQRKKDKTFRDLADVRLNLASRAHMRETGWVWNSSIRPAFGVM